MAVRYMGSKRALAPEIAEIISRDHPGSTVLDVFAGMCAVGTEVSNRHRLFTNDVHAYASTFAEALFTGDGLAATSLVAKSDLLRNFRKNVGALTEVVATRLRVEDKVLAQGADSVNWRSGLHFMEEEQARTPARKLPGLMNMADYRENTALFPYCLFTAYFSGAYFGIRQTIELDSLRYAIDVSDSKRRPQYLAALIEAASHCAAAPGHFAQFLVPRNRKTFGYIVRIRSRSILERFFSALDNFPRPKCFSRRQNRVFTREAVDLLISKRSYFSQQHLVIYADPPYSRAQYSRYYHVLETLVRYDYPACQSKGRYRSDRHQTDFSKRARVVDAMERLSSAAAECNASLYLSYPRNGLLKAAGGSVEDVLRQYFTRVSIVARKSLAHSTMGASSGRASKSVWEDIYCAAN